MPRRSVGKVKTGNIFFIFLIVISIAAYLNKESIQDQLNAWGVLEPPSTVASEKPKKEPATDHTPQVKKKQQNTIKPPKQEASKYKNQNDPFGGGREKVTPKPVPPTPSPSNSTKKTAPSPKEEEASTWTIKGPSGAFLYLNEPNLLTISDQKIANKDLTPVVKESYLKMETKDKDKGIYQITASRKGKATVILMTTVQSPAGKEMIDVVGTQVFTIKDRSDIPEIYTWTLMGKSEDTLWVGQANPLTVEVAEVPPKNIQLDISGAGNAIKPINPNKGLFSTTPIQQEGEVTVTIKLVDNGNVTIIGKKTFTAIAKNKKNAPPQKTAPIVLHNLKAMMAGMTVADKIDSKAFRKAGALLLQNPSGQFVKEAKVIAFNLKHYPVSGKASTLTNNQSHFTNETRQLIHQMKVGDLYRFTDIKVQLKGQDKIVTIAPLTVEVVK